MLIDRRVKRRAGQLVKTTLCTTIAVVMAACDGSSKAPARADLTDPISIAKNPKKDAETRAAALDQAWAERLPGPAGRDMARESLKTVAWAAANGSAVRNRALKILTDDAEDDNHADTRNLMGLMVPIEPDLEVVKFIGQTAAQNGWTDLAAPLVRSWGRRFAQPVDAQRPERDALAGLFPGRPVEESVFMIFGAAPTPGLDGRTKERATEARRGSPGVLSRIDPTGQRRQGLLASLPVNDDPIVAALKACSQDLHCVPVTGSQLKRLERLRVPADAANQKWWMETAAAIARLSGEQQAQLAMRHLEAIRWTAQCRPERMARDKASLSAELRANLKGRMTVRREVGRTESSVGETRDQFADFEQQLSWADVLVLLAVDDAIHAPGIAPELFAQAERDRVNTITEYGGLIEPTGGNNASGFALRLYIPRSGTTGSDNQFVASPDLLRPGVRALAHYHLHAQEISNRNFAGPSPGDLEYAIEQGVPCVVFTSIREGVMNADYYHAGSVIVDLGDVRR